MRPTPAGPDRKPVPVQPVREHIPRITRLLALAVRLEGLLRQGTAKDYADLARLGGVSRARITQVMKLRNLAPVLQERILWLRAHPDFGGNARNSAVHTSLPRVGFVGGVGLRPSPEAKARNRLPCSLAECYLFNCPDGTGAPYCRPTGGRAASPVRTPSGVKGEP
jgi:hypothetical protein